MNSIIAWLDPEEVKRLAAGLLAAAGAEESGPLENPGFGRAFVGYVPRAEAPDGPDAPHAAEAADEGEERLVRLVVPSPRLSAVTRNVLPAVRRPAPVEPPAPAAEVHVPDSTPAAAPEPELVSPPAPAPRSAPASVPSRPVAQAEAAAGTAMTAPGPFLDRMVRFRDWLRQHFEASGIFILDREGGVIFDESGHGKLHFLARSLALTSRRPGNPSANVHVKIGAAATLEVVPVETRYGWFVLGAVVPGPLPPDAVAVIMDALTLVASPQVPGS